MLSETLDSRIAADVLHDFFKVVEQMYVLGSVKNFDFYGVIIDPNAKLGVGEFNDSILARAGIDLDIPERPMIQAIERARTALYLKGTFLANPHMELEPLAGGVTFLHGIPVGIGGSNDLECQVLARHLCDMLLLEVDRIESGEKSETDDESVFDSESETETED